TRAFLRKLSLNAEKNWVQNRGAKRRVMSRDEDMDGSGLVERVGRRSLNSQQRRQFGQKDNPARLEQAVARWQRRSWARGGHSRAEPPRQAQRWGGIIKPARCAAAVAAAPRRAGAPALPWRCILCASAFPRARSLSVACCSLRPRRPGRWRVAV